MPDEGLRHGSAWVSGFGWTIVRVSRHEVLWISLWTGRLAVQFGDEFAWAQVSARGYVLDAFAPLTEDMCRLLAAMESLAATAGLALRPLAALQDPALAARVMVLNEGG